MTQRREPPYPADTRAKGWRFELDVERMEKSLTWLRAKRNDVRAAAMFLWVTSWQQKPCGSLPAHDEDLDLLLGFPDCFFSEHRAVIMRGWYLASDGLLYHPVISEMVHDMLNRRAAEAKRKADWRAKMEHQRNGGESAEAPGDSAASSGVPAGVPRDKGGRDDTGTGTGTGLKKEEARATASRARLNGHEPTQAGAICRAMKAAGIAETNPGHAQLSVLIAAGATEAEFVGAATLAVQKRKGFSYALGIVASQRREAAEKANGLHRGPIEAAKPWDHDGGTIRKKGVELGVGDWDRDAFEHGEPTAETFQRYTQRVRAAVKKREEQHA